MNASSSGKGHTNYSDCEAVTLWHTIVVLSNTTPTLLTPLETDSTEHRAGSSEGGRADPPWRGGAWLVVLVQSGSSRWPGDMRCLQTPLCVGVC